MSEHQYCHDFAYCDSDIIAWFLVAELLSVEGKPLLQHVNGRQKAYPCSGKIEFKVADVQASIERVTEQIAGHNPIIDDTKDLSIEFEDWRTNQRGCNIESLHWLNIEARLSEAQVQKQLEHITALLSTSKC